MLKVKNIYKIFNKGTINQKNAIVDVSLELKEGDFVTVIGGNGAGKSTLLNLISGMYIIDKGVITIDDNDISKKPEYKRAQYIGRVFQDPMTGTCADMTIEENLAMALRRGKKRTLKWGITKEEKELFKTQLKLLDLGLENRMTSKVGLLSGGQRQALTLLMATITKPRLLLLDEHTAALDPKTAKKVLELTEKLIKENHLTAIMITHNMKDAINYGNRLFMMNDGQLVLDIHEDKKNDLQVSDLLQMFEVATGEEMDNDRMLLG